MKTRILDVSTHAGSDSRPGFTSYTVRPGGVMCEVKHDGPAIYGWTKGAEVELPPSDRLRQGKPTRAGGLVFYIPDALADELDAAQRAAADSYAPGGASGDAPPAVLTEARLMAIERRLNEIHEMVAAACVLHERADLAAIAEEIPF